MFALLVHDPIAPAAPTHQTYFGGLPSMASGSTWPVCRSCRGNMQFLGQVQDAADHHIALFMCQNDPGMCDEWDPSAGGNCALPIDGIALEVISPPTTGEVTRPVSHGMRPVVFKEGDYGQACDAWLAAGNDALAILGSIGGVPDWIQGDESPTCDYCSEPMNFVAQLEEGLDHRTAMNFGGRGRAYVFRCSCEHKTAKFLWQS